MNVDVVIVGGGVVGATLALALGRGGLRMAIVEASPPRAITRTAAAYDLRVSALTPASAQVLRALGVWERLPVARLTPFHRMEVWESDGGAIDFDAADIGAAALGYIVENQLIQDGLESALASLDNVTWHRPATVEAFRAGAEEVVVTAGGSTLRAKLLVGGRRPAFGRFASWRALPIRKRVMTNVPSLLTLRLNIPTAMSRVNVFCQPGH